MPRKLTPPLPDLTAPDQPEFKLEPEFHAPYHEWKATPSPASAGRLLKAVSPAIEHGLKTYGGANVNPMLRSRAKAITLDALGAYDPSQGPLRPHLSSHLQGLRRYSARQQQMISVPERVALEKMHLDEADRELEDRHGRPASDLELADHTGMSLARIRTVRKYRPGFAEGQLVAARNEEGEEAGGDVAVEREDPHAARALLIYHDLDPVGRAILDHGLGLHGRPRMPVGMIAAKFKLSPAAISQRAARIQAMLDEVADRGVF